ncbi:hypothetical protein ACLB1N_26115 [Escherichia coli]
MKTHQCGCTGQYGPAKQSGAIAVYRSDRRDEGFGREQMARSNTRARRGL